MPRTVTLRGEQYPVLLPSLRDPRLHLAATIISLHVIGQVYLRFELSIAQILVCLLTCAAIEIPLVMRQQHVLAWPASALLTGNGVAFLLRFNGTEHGDWWSLQGWYVFAATSAVALLSKHALRSRGRPIFNPSNLGLALCFLILGTDLVNPLDFWWGPLSTPLVAVLVVITLGGLVVTARLRLIGASLAFWSVFAGGLAYLATTGHCISARWSIDPVCDATFWQVLVTSPETLVFCLFMLTDPKTVPVGSRDRLLFGAWVGLVAVVLIAGAQTEFWAKVALLCALVLCCGVRALLPVLTPAVVRRRLGIAAAVGLVALVPLLAPLARPAPASGGPTLGARPAIELPALPPVEVAEDVRLVSAALDQAAAERAARQLVLCLAVEARALAEGDRTMLTSAVTGPRLARDLRLLQERPVTAPRSYSSLRVLLIRDPTDPQAVPQLGVHATGTLGAEPFDATFEIVAVGDGYLVADER